MSEVRKVLAEQIGSTLVTIAKDVKIQVEFNPLQVASYRLLGYENRVLADRDFADDTKDAGEIGAGYSVTALYEVVPAGAPTAGTVKPLKYQGKRETTAAARSGELLDVHIRYKEPDGDTSKELAFAVRDAGGTFVDASADTRWAAAVAGFGMLLRDSPNKGSLDWEWVRQTARAALDTDAAGYRAEFLGMVERARRVHPGS
jgi:Ca-activated chloride channel family protein